MEKIKVLNIDAYAITESELMEGLDKNLSGEGGNGVLITPNLDHLVKLQKDEEFYHCYQQAEWIVCDSKILCLFSKLLPKSFPEAIPGSSFFTHFYEAHKDDLNCKIYLLGAMDGVALKAQERINKRMGREIVVGAYSPSYGFEKKQDENEEIYKMINDSGANVVLVGVGAPKQEKWIAKHREKMPNVKIWMALGATIDFESGTLSRAPKWVQACYMEWLYRIFCDPKRMFKRYFGDDLVFFWYLLKQVFGKYKNPFEK